MVGDFSSRDSSIIYFIFELHAGCVTNYVVHIIERRIWTR